MNTEPAYFEAIRRLYSEALIEIEIASETGVPMTLAKAAKKVADKMGLAGTKKRRKDSFEQNDQVWIVFDTDDHPNINEARQLCKANNIGLAHSSPCFEIWLILHIEDFDRPDGRQAVQKHLEKILAGYDRKKGKSCDCQPLVSSLNDAETRAEKQLARRLDEESPNGPPSTTVFKLTREIGEAAAASAKR
ncbi:MAG: RloB family protein [Rhizobiaceae bacterium]